MEKKIILNRLAGLIGLISLLVIADLSAFAGDWLKEKILTLYQDKELCLLILAVLFTLFAWFLMEAVNGRWVAGVLMIAYVFLYVMLRIETASFIWAFVGLVAVTVIGSFAVVLAADTRKPRLKI